jgi:hypothetical protein
VALQAIDTRGPRLRGAAARLLAFGAPCTLVFALCVPFVFLNTAAFMDAMRLLMESMETGQPHLDLQPGWIHHVQFSLRYGVGLGIFAAGLIGMAAMLRRDTRRALLFVSFPVAYYAVAGASRNQFFRYMIPVVPFLCISAAGVVASAHGRVQAWPGGRWWHGPRAAAAFAVVMAVGLAAEPAIRIVQFDRVLARLDNRVLTSRWFSEHVPAGDSILQSGSRYGHPWFDENMHYRLWTWDPGLGDFRLPDAASEERPDWILVQESPLSSNRPLIDDYLKEGYALAWQFPAMTMNRTDRVFDYEDAFFLPFAGFGGVTRPGPNFTLYQRVPDLLPPTPRE